MPNYSDIWKEMDCDIARMKQQIRRSYPLTAEKAQAYFEDCSDDLSLGDREEFLDEYERRLWKMEYERRFLLRPSDNETLLRPLSGPGEDKNLLRPSGDPND